MTNTDDAKTQGDYVSTAPETSALTQGGTSQGKSARALKKEARKEAQKAHPWRDNIEAIAISIVTTVMFKYFVLEAYKIPTGSMQPTLMGNAETGIYDRVIVDKFSYHFRDPVRFEIAVFKYPLDSSKNYIKRIVGMPGERLYIEGGDLWTQKGDEEPQVLRRPRSIQDAQLRRIETGGAWESKRRPKGWSLATDVDDGDTISTRGPGEISYPESHKSIRDGYLDGYARSLKPAISESNKGSRVNTVTDLRVATEVIAGSGVEAVTLVIREGDRSFRFALAGPDAGEAKPAAISAVGDEFAGAEFSGAEFNGSGPTTGTAFQLHADQPVDVEVQNLNNLLELRVNGELIASMEVPPAPHNGRHPNDAKSRVTFEVAASDGAYAEAKDLKIWRDIFYTFTQGPNPVTEWLIPDDCYVVLGDNTQDSSDGRDWTIAQFQPKEGGGPVMRGNSRERRDPITRKIIHHPESNPQHGPEDADGSHDIFLRDERGELRVLNSASVNRLPDEHLSFVPRDLVRGRAVVVAWPISFKYGIFRPKWVR